MAYTFYMLINCYNNIALKKSSMNHSKWLIARRIIIRNITIDFTGISHSVIRTMYMSYDYVSQGLLSPKT